MHWDFALILLFLGIAVPLLGRRRLRKLLQSPQTTKTDRLVLYASTIVFQWLAVALILWRTHVHAITPARLGLAHSACRLDPRRFRFPGRAHSRQPARQSAASLHSSGRDPRHPAATGHEGLSAGFERAPRLFRTGRDRRRLRGAHLPRLRPARFPGLVGRTGRGGDYRLSRHVCPRSPVPGPSGSARYIRSRPALLRSFAPLPEVFSPR